MPFIDELQKAFNQLHSMLENDQSNELLAVPYAEFTLQSYAKYAQPIYETLLSPNAPLTNAFCAMGIDTPRDQLLMLLDTFYLSRHICAKSID